MSIELLRELPVTLEELYLSHQMISPGFLDYEVNLPLLKVLYLRGFERMDVPDGQPKLALIKNSPLLESLTIANLSYLAIDVRPYVSKLKHLYSLTIDAFVRSPGELKRGQKVNFIDGNITLGSDGILSIDIDEEDVIQTKTFVAVMAMSTD